MIEVLGLVKRFGDTTALDGVTFRVERGEIVGFLGPNGAGKSTTLRILSTFLTQDEGVARVAGFDVLREAMDVRRRIGYLPEHPPLDLDHTVGEYLGFCAALRGVPRKGRRAAVSSVIDRCGLGQGMVTQLHLALIMAIDAKLLVLDEPTIGLDPHQIREIRNLIRSLAGDHTVLLSSHILPEVAMTCSRAVVIHRGRVAADVLVDAAAAGSGLEAIFLRVTSRDVAVGEEGVL